MNRARVYMIFPIVLILGAFVFWELGMKNRIDYIGEYETLLTKVRSKESSADSREPFTAMQYRYGVAKDIYFSNEQQNLNMKVYCDKSALLYNYQTVGTEMVEKLSTVECLIQEELFYITAEGEEVIGVADNFFLRDRKNREESRVPLIDRETLTPMQKIRYIKADSAVYQITGDSITAYDAEIYHLQLPSHCLPRSPLLEAEMLVKSFADEIFISIKNKDVRCSMRGLKGQLNYPGK